MFWLGSLTGFPQRMDDLPVQELIPQQGGAHSARCHGGRNQEILGRWLKQNEGAKFWLRVMNERATAASKMACPPWSMA